MVVNPLLDDCGVTSVIAGIIVEVYPGRVTTDSGAVIVDI